MEKLILTDFWDKHSNLMKNQGDLNQFTNNDNLLKNEAEKVIENRIAIGLEGLVGGLQCIILNTQREHQLLAVDELLKFTGHDLKYAYEDKDFVTYVLSLEGSADILVRSRKHSNNIFRDYNMHPKAENLPDTRLETFVFETTDIEKYYSIQKSRGVKFITDGIVYKENYSFIQTIPSSFTGNSIGIIQWKNKGKYLNSDDIPVVSHIKKPALKYTKHIKNIDHAATRVKAADRDAAIIEYMELTNYNFDFAIYVENLNSITNVARQKGEKFAMVFTSGISPYVNDELSGPTEKFINNYGTRVHHLAFLTDNIAETFNDLKKNRMGFLSELVGSEEDGLMQAFTNPSNNTFIVNEYILRFGDFDGFFTKSNVTLLTKSTENQ